MRIKSIRVQNLRAIRDCTLYLDSLTALVGPEGVDKSTFLHALMLFQGITAASEEDYHNRDTSEPIEVKITFDELPDPAKERLSRYVRNSELDVARIIHFVCHALPTAREGTMITGTSYSSTCPSDGIIAAHAGWHRIFRKQMPTCLIRPTLGQHGGELDAG